VTWRQLGAVVAVGTAGAVLAYARAPGLGWVMTSSLLAAAVLVGRRGRGDGADAWQRAAGLVALALAVLPVLTDARWVLIVTVLGAAGLGTLAVGGGVTWRGVVVPGARTVVVACAGVAASGRRLAGAASYAPRAGRHLRTAAVTGVLVLVFGGLFSSADAAFAGVVDLLVPDVSIDGFVGRSVVGSALAVVCLTLVLLRRDPADDVAAPVRRTLVGSEWLVPLAVLVLLFAAFVVVQIGTLFGGDAFVARTAGLTYAAYAREGFGQLLAAAALTLGVVGSAGRYAATRAPSEERLRRGLLAALCGLTLVVLASAFQRLALYEAAFGFTRARITAHATILWLGGLFVLVLVLGALRRTERLPRAAVLLTGVALLAFGLVRPDAVVARANVARFEATGQLDVAVLASLSDDAVPTLTRLPPQVATCVTGDARPPEGTTDPLAWNLARARAAEARATVVDATCREPHPAPGPA
jgi:hypothetical protein